jgi:guanylate kinase
MLSTRLIILLILIMILMMYESDSLQRMLNIRHQLSSASVKTLLSSSKSPSNNIAHSVEQMKDFKEFDGLDLELLSTIIQQWSQPLPRSYLHKPLVLVGPSGVGKGRMVKSLLNDYQKFFKKVVTHTTRKPRPDETNQTSYNYVSNETFHELRKNDTYFLEWAKVHNNFYGTSASSWAAITAQGKIPIMEIDIQGARSIKDSALGLGIQPIFLFVAPPSIDMLKSRLTRRNTESDEEIELRLTNAGIELAEATAAPDLFDHIIVNDNFETAVNAFFRFVRDNYPAIPSASRIRMFQRRIRDIKKTLVVPSAGEESTGYFEAGASKAQQSQTTTE